MNTNATNTGTSDTTAAPPTLNWKLELVGIPVTDIDRAKAFYVDQVGFIEDYDVRVNDSIRFIQLTPPGSACSVCMGQGIVEMAPGTQLGLQIVVPNADDARRHLLDNGVAASEVNDLDWGRFVYFADPDGNTWALQELPKRG